MLQFVGFPTPEVLGSGAGEEAIRAMLAKYGQIVLKPVSNIATSAVGHVAPQRSPRLVGEWLIRERERRLFYPFSTSDSSGYRSQMKSTKARTFGVGRRLDVWRIHKATSEPEIAPH